MITTVTAKSTDLPVSLDEMKRHLRVMDGALDEHIIALTEAATEYAESVCGRSLRVSQTLTQSYCHWPCNPVKFDREPVSAISSVKYRDANGTLQTLASSNYRLHKSINAGSHLEFDADFSAPTLDDRDDAVVIEFVAGYATLEDVPAMAKHAIKLIVGHWFNHNEAVNVGNITSEVPLAAGALLAQLDPGYYR